MVLRRRYIQIGILLGLLSLYIIASLLSPSRLGKGYNYMDSLSLSLWLPNGHAKVTDSQSPFNKMVTAFLSKRRKEDIEDKFWLVDTKLTPYQTELTIPDYFYKDKKSRPAVMPFDPRFTLAFYYNYMTRHAENHKFQLPFFWGDWVDLSVLDADLFNPDKSETSCSEFDFIEYLKSRWPDLDKGTHKGAMKPELFCQATKDSSPGSLGYVIDRYFGRMTQEGAIRAGKAYLYTSAPNPNSVIFLTKDGSYHAEVKPTPVSLLKNGLVDAFISSENLRTINTLDEFRKLQKTLPSKKDEVVNTYEVKLQHEDFVMDHEAITKLLEELAKSGGLNKVQKLYKEAFKVAVDMRKGPPKYFNEAKVFDTMVGDHYDFRFFGGFKVGSKEQTNTLHRMVRTWLSFTRKQGIITWMAHGSLLSWYWNGIAFPWDNDIDVQMPIMHLHKLSMNFNQSLIIEDGEDGFGRYFLDCGAYIVTRDHNNGNNNIDARFIDVDSGLYIDITGLAVSSDKMPGRYNDLMKKYNTPNNIGSYETNDALNIYNCRNNHFSSLSELSPLVKTFVEGEVAYIPKRYSDILTFEYKDKGLLQKFFKGMLFMPQLRLWVPQSTLLFFIRQREEWIEFHQSGGNKGRRPSIEGGLANHEVADLISLDDSDLMTLLLDDDLLMDYVVSRDLTAVHENEIMRLLFGKSTQEIVLNAPDFQPMMYEPFLYRLNQIMATFEGRVKKYEEKTRIYLSEIGKLNSEPSLEPKAEIKQLDEDSEYEPEVSAGNEENKDANKDNQESSNNKEESKDKEATENKDDNGGKNESENKEGESKDEQKSDDSKNDKDETQNKENSENKDGFEESDKKEKSDGSDNKDEKEASVEGPEAKNDQEKKD